MDIDPSWVTGIGTVVLALATTVLAVVTGVYVIKTGEALEASRRSARAAEEAASHARTAAEATERVAQAAERAELTGSIPLLTARIQRKSQDPGGPLDFMTTVINAGPGEALNVGVQLFDEQLGGPLASIVGALPPHGEATGTVRSPVPAPEQLEVQVRYQDRQGREYLAFQRKGLGWSYGHIRRPYGSGEFLDLLIEATPHLS